MLVVRASAVPSSLLPAGEDYVFAWRGHTLVIAHRAETAAAALSDLIGSEIRARERDVIQLEANPLT